MGHILQQNCNSSQNRACRMKHRIIIDRQYIWLYPIEHDIQFCTQDFSPKKKKTLLSPKNHFLGNMIVSHNILLLRRKKMGGGGGGLGQKQWFFDQNRQNHTISIPYLQHNPIISIQHIQNNQSVTKFLQQNWIHPQNKSTQI